MTRRGGRAWDADEEHFIRLPKVSDRRMFYEQGNFLYVRVNANTITKDDLIELYEQEGVSSGGMGGRFLKCLGQQIPIGNIPSLRALLETLEEVTNIFASVLGSQGEHGEDVLRAHAFEHWQSILVMIDQGNIREAAEKMRELMETLTNSQNIVTKLMASDKHEAMANGAYHVFEHEGDHLVKFYFTWSEAAYAFTEAVEKLASIEDTMTHCIRRIDQGASRIRHLLSDGTKVTALRTFLDESVGTPTSLGFNVDALAYVSTLKKNKDRTPSPLWREHVSKAEMLIVEAESQISQLVTEWEALEKICETEIFTNKPAIEELCETIKTTSRTVRECDQDERGKLKPYQIPNADITADDFKRAEKYLKDAQHRWSASEAKQRLFSMLASATDKLGEKPELSVTIVQLMKQAKERIAEVKGLEPKEKKTSSTPIVIEAVAPVFSNEELEQLYKAAVCVAYERTRKSNRGWSTEFPAIVKTLVELKLCEGGRDVAAALKTMAYQKGDVEDVAKDGCDGPASFKKRWESSQKLWLAFMYRSGRRCMPQMRFKIAAGAYPKCERMLKELGLTLAQITAAKIAVKELGMQQSRERKKRTEE